MVLFYRKHKFLPEKKLFCTQFGSFIIYGSRCERFWYKSSCKWASGWMNKIYFAPFIKIDHHATVSIH